MRDSSDNGPGVTHGNLRTPRAAAIAGVVFSILLFAVFVLMRHSVLRDPLETGAWLRTGATNVVIALNLVPLAGIGFLWCRRSRTLAGCHRAPPSSQGRRAADCQNGAFDP